jgi:hypothetical protein
MDPVRADRLRNPVVRLYGEYIWGYISAIRHAPLTPSERRECYRHLADWATSRVRSGRSEPAEQPSAPMAEISVRAVVAGQESRAS